MTLAQAALIEWTERVREALLAVNKESWQRKGMVQPKYEQVFFPGHFGLLTWKVWCQRYNVSPEFLLTFILRWYEHCRRPSRNPKVLALGLPTALITGSSARLALEDHIKRLYPAGENLRDAAQQLRQRILDVGTPGRVSYSTDAGTMAQNYQKAILARRREAVEPTFRRPWRGNPF